MRRIQFFSVHDGASGHYLRELGNRFSDLDQKDSLDINDLLELYNAKLYIDNEMYLTVWDEQKKNELKDQTANNWQKIKYFFLQINSESLLSIFEQVDFKYRKHFWEIVDQLDVYKKINEESVEAILIAQPNEVRNILKQQRLVNRFSTVVRNHLLSNPKSAELLLSEEDHSDRKTKFFFPKALSNNDKEKIINDYLDQDSPNLNYVSLALYAKESATLRLSDRTRLKAKRTQDRLSEEFLTSNRSATQVYGVEVGTQDQKDEPIRYKWEGTTFKATYDIDFFMELLREENLSLIFQNLFHFTDKQGLITLVSKSSETTTIENIFMRSKNEYGSSMVFSRKSMLSLGQIALANNLLEKESKNISDLIAKHLITISTFNEELKKLRFKMPSASLSDEERIRIVAPSLESLLNQYSLYVSDGEIDFELLEISSKPISFAGIASKVSTKYIYPALDSKLGRLFYTFFSDQSVLHYVEPYKNKYDCFYDLLINEKSISYNSFEDYQKDAMDSLIAEDILFLEHGEFLKITNENQLFIIAMLYKNGVISYWHFPPTFRDELDALVKQELCYPESKLFTKHEVTYLNYYLNKKEFTDGPDLRNKYLHGTNIDSNNNSQNDYMLYLRIVILCLLKIEDDLILVEESKN